MPIEKPAATASANGPSLGYEARQLLRQSTVATLATIDRATGAPYASLVQVATAPDASPVLLISALARHTQNLAADPRASLLVDSRTRAGDPLTALRTTMIGRAAADDTVHGRARFLRRHPGAADYSAFGDFGFWRLDVSVAHTIAGFGRIRELPGEAVLLVHPVVAELAASEERLIARSAGRLIGIDVEGIDLASGERRQFAVPLDDLSAAESRIAQLL